MTFGWKFNGKGEGRLRKVQTCHEISKTRRFGTRCVFVRLLGSIFPTIFPFLLPFVSSLSHFFQLSDILTTSILKLNQRNFKYFYFYFYFLIKNTRITKFILIRKTCTRKLALFYRQKILRDDTKIFLRKIASECFQFPIKIHRNVALKSY